MITLVTILVLGRVACVVSRLLLQRETTFIKVLYIFYLIASFICLFVLFLVLALVCAHFMLFVENLC